ncbi:putative inhibitor of apoptosis isoform X3 [Haliotis rubra]|uniref:putative inhibitor of apoptosis isoform X1 n=1 Tax=Haliotis rubra TaxID=36100 RepID=UPI001EE593B7|nr:putative inhibitor of apoptosis isoform X1 [Haliotis rubra]XP_046545621.1 putative inhibitor of apoptosis isoform X2 [Haliotis rubra]XP_046545622.1 putative inhibitor of apoptosis isoform X3 [Haliotis rubra]
MSEHTVLAQESLSLLPNPQQHQVQETTGLQDEGLCKVCLEKTSCVLFLPCAHLVTCMECVPALRKCHVCRAFIRGTVRVYNE